MTASSRSFGLNKTRREIETTITHPFLTINGWKKLEKIKVGEKIAVPRILNVFGKDSMARM
jgi:replicative DNA helicase